MYNSLKTAKPFAIRLCTPLFENKATAENTQKKQPHSKQQYARCLFACYSFQCDSVSVLKSNRLQYEHFTFSSLVALCVRLWAVSK